MCYRLQTDDRAYECGNKEQPHKGSRFFKKQNAYHHRAYRAYARPYCISRTHRKGLGGFVKQVHAYGKTYEKTCEPI